MADMLTTGISGLLAVQQELNTTSNNISNANTPGYSVEQVNLATTPSSLEGSSWVGTGVQVTGVQRSYSDLVAAQLNSATSAYNQLNTVATQASQIDNMLGDSTTGLSASLQNFVNAAQTVANSPTSSASRQALLSQAQTLVAGLQSYNATLQTQQSQASSQISTEAATVTSLAQSIASVNQQIVTASDGGAQQAPNDLLDQRDQLLTQLASHVSITTTQMSDDSINVYIGSGQSLVSGSTASTLVATPNQYDPTQMDVSLQTAFGTQDVTQSLNGGTLGGMLQFRSQILDPAINSLGQMAVALSAAVNQQNSAGLDLSGNPGGDFFAVGGVGVQPSSDNSGNATVAASISDAGAISTSNDILAFNNGTWTLTRADTGASVTLTGAGTAASPLVGDGISMVVSGTPQSGDSYQIEPTANAVSGMQVLITDPNKIAAAAPLLTAAASGNTGTGSIDAGSVPNSSTWVRGNYTLSFTSPAAWQITNAAGTVVANGAYASGTPINFNGIQVSVSGAPATGDSFSIDDNANGSGDNRNALAMANILDQPLLDGGTTSINDAVGQFVASVGVQTQQAQTGSSAQNALLTSATANQQSISGVNLDQEAANLVQYQQAYQASAQVIATAESLFQSFITALQSG